MRQLEALRDQERRQREQTSECSQPGETSTDSNVNQAGRTGNASQSIETSKEVHHA